MRRIEKGRGHTYEIDGKTADGVTTILGEGLGVAFAIPSGWAARICASYAVDNWAELSEASVSERMQRIRSAPNRESEETARRGTDIHHFAEMLVAGEEVDVPDALLDHVKQAVQFFDDFNVQPIAVERPCFSKRWNYGGTFDLIADVKGYGRLLIDFKTGKNVYADKTALQLAAYRYAETYITHEDEVTEMPPLDGALVVHVKSDSYEALPIDASVLAHRIFLYIQQVARFRGSAHGLIDLPIHPVQEASA